MFCLLGHVQFSGTVMPHKHWRTGFMILLLQTFLHDYSDQDKEDEMGRTCSTHEITEKCIQNISRGSLREMSLVNPVHGWGLIFQWMLQTERSCGLDSSGSGKDLVAGPCLYDNESSGFIKEGVFIEQFSDCQLFEKGPAYLITLGRKYLSKLTGCGLDFDPCRLGMTSLSVLGLC